MSQKKPSNEGPTLSRLVLRDIIYMHDQLRESLILMSKLRPGNTVYQCQLHREVANNIDTCVVFLRSMIRDIRQELDIHVHVPAIDGDKPKKKKVGRPKNLM